MKQCPICNKKFTIWERLTSKDEKHYNECKIKEMENDLAKTRERINKKLFNTREWINNNTTKIKRDNEPNYQNNQDVVTPITTAIIVDSIFDDHRIVAEASQSFINSGGGEFSGAGSSYSWNEVNTNVDNSSNCNSCSNDFGCSISSVNNYSSNSYSSSYDSGSSSSYDSGSSSSDW